MTPANLIIDPLAYSVKDACRVSSLGRTRLYQLIGEGRLEVRKHGARSASAMEAAAYIKAMARLVRDEEC